MYIALNLFLSLTIIGNLIRVFDVAADRHLVPAGRVAITMWYLFCIIFAAVLITIFACR